MASNGAPRYDSYRCSMPEHLYADFIASCKEEGIDAKVVKCFSINLRSFVGVLYETSEKLHVLIPKLLKVLAMFEKKHNVKIETPSGTLTLNGYDHEEAIKIIAAAQAIMITPNTSKINDDKTHSCGEV